MLSNSSIICLFCRFLEGMSELDDKVAHLRQDMSLYRRQLENKRGDDEVSECLLVDVRETYF